MPDRLLVSDLDGTLIPSEDDPRHREGLSRFAAAMAAAEDVRLAYATGRRIGLAEDAIEQFGLPSPDFLACDVGTRLYRRGAGGFDPDGGYAERMRDAMGGTTATEIFELLSTIPGLTPQPEVDQSEFKSSFDFPSSRRAPILRAVSERLEGRAVAVVESHDPYTGAGLLDILPAGVAKDTAVHHLREGLGLAPESVCYAGDSGNDLAAMLSGYRVIVVGNAPAAFRVQLAADARERGLTDQLYYAEAPYAEGVLEGCAHWGLFSPQ